MERYLIFDFDGVIGDTQEASARATMVTDNLNYEMLRQKIFAIHLTSPIIHEITLKQTKRCMLRTNGHDSLVNS